MLNDSSNLQTPPLVDGDASHSLIPRLPTEYNPLELMRRESEMQSQLVERLNSTSPEVLDDLNQRAIAELAAKGFSSTKIPAGEVFTFSLTPSVISRERYEHNEEIDRLIETASWKLLQNLTEPEEQLLFTGFQEAEKRLVKADLALRVGQGATYPSFRRVDRLGGYDVMTGQDTDMRWLEQNAISPDAGAYQKAMAEVSNQLLLPFIREVTGMDLPDIPVMWDSLIEEMRVEAQRVGKELESVGIVYLESGNHQHKDVEMPELQRYLESKGLKADIITQSEIIDALPELSKYSVLYRAFDTSHLLTQGGLAAVADYLAEHPLPMVGRPSETVFGAKALMGILSRAARTQDNRLLETEHQAIQEAMGWKDAFHSNFQPNILNPDGQEVPWEDFIRKNGRKIYLKANMGGSGHGVLRIDNLTILDEEELINKAREVMEQQGYALEVEGMVGTYSRSYLFSDGKGGEVKTVEAAADLTTYSIGREPIDSGFGRFSILPHKGMDDPSGLKNVSQGGGTSIAIICDI